MAMTSVNYPAPVMVNGYMCKNCTDVDHAKAHVDPQHPNAGPYDVNAKADPSLTGKAAGGNGTDSQSGVSFGGALSSLNAVPSAAPSLSARPSPAAPPVSPRGSQLDLSA